MAKLEPTDDTPDLEKGGIPATDVDVPGKAGDPPDQSEPDATSANEHQPIGTTGRKLEGDRDAPYASHCRPEAAIWGLYLKETEIEDKEVTELWNNSLDSLLVFAGLFAGILTAFLIDSRQDLTENPQEHLLKEIVNILRNTTDSSTFEPDPSSINVNGLWFASLTLTLISALGAVLAKGWLAKYNPASNREQSSDACERHLRAVRARQWRLEPFITGIPLLIQVSLFLFFAGLIIQVLDNDVRIWSVVVILVGLVALIYFVGTWLPWFSPACPFQTPFSDFLGGGTARGRYRDDTTANRTWNIPSGSWKKRLLALIDVPYKFLEEVHRRPEPLVLQAQILSWVIMNSTKEATIEEAIGVVAGSKQTKELQGALIESKVRDSLYQRFEDCLQAAPGPPKTTNDGPKLEVLLYALLRIEQPLHIDEGPSHDHEVSSLLDDGRPLHRWDDFEPYLQALVFSLRIHMFVNCDRDDHDENWEETVKSLTRMAEIGSVPYIRRILFFATIRGLLRGQKIVRRTCGIVLSKQVSIADVRENIYNLGGPNQSTSGGDNPNIPVIHEELAKRLAQLCGDDDSHSKEAGMQVLLTLEASRKMTNLILVAIPELVTLLKSGNAEVQIATVSALSSWTGHASHREALGAAIPLFIDLLRFQRAIAPALVKLANQVDLRAAISSVIPSLINLIDDPFLERTWGEDSNFLVISTLGQLAERVEFHQALSAGIPSLVKRLSDPFCQEEVFSILVNLAGHREARVAISNIIPPLVEIFKEGYPKMDDTAVSAFVKLVKHAGLHTAVRVSIQSFIELLEKEPDSVPPATISILARLAEHAEYRKDIGAAIPLLVPLFETRNSDVHAATASAFYELAQYVEFHAEIDSAIALLLQYKEPDIRAVTASALAKLAAYAGYRKAIDASIPSIVELFQNHPSTINALTISALVKLAGHAEYEKDIRATIPLLVQLLKDPTSAADVVADSAPGELSEHVEMRRESILEYQRYKIQAAAASALAKLSEHVALRSIIATAIPFLVKLLNIDDSDLQAATASSFAELAEIVELRVEIGSAIPLLVELLADWKDETSAAAASALVKVSGNAELTLAIVTAIPTLFKLLNDPESGRQIQAVSALVKLAENAELRGAISAVIPMLIELLKDWRNPARAASLLVKLAGYPEYRKEIGAAIPSFIEWLGDRSYDIWGPVMPLLAGLAAHSEFREAIGVTIPSLIRHLEENSLRPESTASLVIYNLSQSTTLRAAISSFILSHSISSPSAEDNSHRTVIQHPITSSYQLIPPRHVPSHLLGALAPNPQRSAVTQLWYLLNSKDSYSLQSGVESLSRLAKTFREVVQPVGDTMRKLIKEAPNRVLLNLPDIAEHAKLREVVFAAIPSLIERLHAWESRGSTRVVLAKLAKLTNPEHQKIIESTVSLLVRLLGDRKSIGQAASALSELAEHAVYRKMMGSAIPLLVTLLAEKESGAHKEVVSTLAKLAEYVDHRDAVGSAVPFLVRVLKQDSSTARVAASALAKLAKHSKFRTSIDTAISSLVDSGIGFEYSDGRIGSKVDSWLTVLAEHAQLRETVHGAISALAETLKRQPSGEDRVTVASVLAELSKHAELRTVIGATIPSLVKMLADWPAGEAVALALAKLAMHAELQVEIIPSLLDLLGDPTRNGGKNAISTLIELAENAEYRSVIGPTIPLILKFLEKRDSYVRAATIAKLADHTEFHASLVGSIPSLVELLTDEYPKVRARAASALARLPGHIDHPDIIATVIPSLIELLNEDGNYPEDDAAASAIANLAAHAEYRHVIVPAIPSLFKLLVRELDDVAAAATRALIELAKHDETRSEIDTVIPSLVGIVNGAGSWYKTRVPSVLITLADRVEIRATIGNMFVKLIGDRNPKTIEAAASALVRLAEHADVHEAIGAVIPSLVELISRRNLKNVTPTIVDLAKHEGLQTDIGGAIPLLLQLFTYSLPEHSRGLKSSEEISSEAAALICTLAKHSFFRRFLVEHLKDILQLLKDNVATARAAAANVIEALLNYPDTRKALLQSNLPARMVDLLHDRDANALMPLTNIFCFLVNQGHIHTGIVQVVLDSLNALDHSEGSVQRCGATILLVMGSHARFRNILFEIFTIREGIRYFMQDISGREADLIVQRMEYFGVLREPVIPLPSEERRSQSVMRAIF